MSTINPADLDVSPGALPTDPTPAMLEDGAHLTHPNHQERIMTTEQETVPMQVAPEPTQTSEAVQQGVDPTPSEVATIEISDRTVTMSFSRKTQPKQYEAAEAFVSTKFTVPDDANLIDLEPVIQQEFMKIKSVVYNQLDLPFTYDEATTRVLEAFADSTVVAQPAPQQAFQGTNFSPAPVTPQAAPQAQGGFAQPAGGPQFAAPAAGAQPTWDDFMADTSQWQDKRASKTKPTQPDFVHTTIKNAKGYGAGLWINDKTPMNVRQFLGLA